MENYIAHLSLAEKQLLKEWVESKFEGQELLLNAMGFLHDEARGLVTVEGLIEGDEIDGLAYPVSDFTAMVNRVLEDVVIYHTAEEKAAALRHYLSQLSLHDKQKLRSHLRRLTIDGEIVLTNLEFLYDMETDDVVVNVRENDRDIDQMDLSRIDFLAVVREVVGDAEVAG